MKIASLHASLAVIAYSSRNRRKSIKPKSIAFRAAAAATAAAKAAYLSTRGILFSSIHVFRHSF